MNSWFDESGQEYGIDTSGMKLFSDESLEFEIPMESISKETLAELIGGVPIIRCKDCIKKELCSVYRDARQELGFCAWAERKEE